MISVSLWVRRVLVIGQLAIATTRLIQKNRAGDEPRPYKNAHITAENTELDREKNAYQ